MSDHRFCENRFQADKQTIEVLLNAVRLAYKLAKCDYDNAVKTNDSQIVIDANFEAMDLFRKAIEQAEEK